MEKQGYIKEEQVNEVLNTEISVVCYGYSESDIKAPHFVMYVKKVLTDMFGEKLVEQGGLRVMTTLDWSTQQVAQEEAVKQIDALKAKNANATNAGVVVTDPTTGHILAMVGSVDYFDKEHDGNVNVTLAQRQPGSSIKPLTYLTAFKMGYSPSTFVSDIKTCFPGGAGQPDYCPVNWDDKYWGPMSVRVALANSRNLPAVKMLDVVGVDNMIDMAHDLGITSLNENDRYGLSLTLGGGEVRLIDMAQVFSVFADMGERNDLTPITRVEDSTGKVLHEFKQAGRKVVDPEYIYLINNILSDSEARKATFGASLEIGRPLAVKTGTTNDNRDAWTIGYTPQLVTAVWVGNFNNDQMRGIMGSTGATPIMKGVMTRVLKGKESKNWEQPKEVVNKTVDRLSGLIPQEGRGYPTINEIFVKGSEPTNVDDFHVLAQVCRSDNRKLALPYHIEHELAEEKTFIYLKELSKDWQKYTDEWMAANQTDGYGSLPTEKCAITVEGSDVAGPIIEITSPKGGEQITSEKFTVTAEVYGDERITLVKFFWDDELISTVNSEPYKAEYDLSKISSSKLSDGVHRIRVTATDAAGEASEQSMEITYKKTTAGGGPGTVNGTITVSATPTPSLRERIRDRLDDED
jgi:membrane peptidoglycan carboxypeptidase